MTSWEQFDEIFELKGGAKNVACRHSSRINYDGTIEITLNPSNTKSFKSTEEDYFKLYGKIMRFIFSSLDTFIKVTSDRYVFEFCKSRKRHLHAWIKVEPLQDINPMGVIYYISEYIARLLRRKVLDSCCFPQYNRVQTLPFCIQYTDIFNKPMGEIKRIDYWRCYIEKTQ